MTGRILTLAKFPIITALGALIFVSIDIAHKSNDTLATATPFPTPINLPFAPRALDELETLLLPHEECTLPCFWEFRPGFSTIDEVAAFLQLKTGIGYFEDILVLDYHFIEEGSTDPIFSITFTVDQGILSWMQVFLEDLDEWLPDNTLSMATLFERVDSEPEIYVSINAATNMFFVLVVHNDKGVMAQYAFEFQEDEFTESNNPIILCPLMERNTSLVLWLQNEDQPTPVQEHIDLPPRSNINGLRDIDESIEFFTGMDSATFIDHITNHATECIEAFSYIELRRRGYVF
jgi:hypothetical protein